MRPNTVCMVVHFTGRFRPLNGRIVTVTGPSYQTQDTALTIGGVCHPITPLLLHPTLPEFKINGLNAENLMPLWSPPPRAAPNEQESTHEGHAR